MFLQHTDNAPEVRAMFKQQLEQREKPKHKEARKPKNEVNEMPKVEKPNPPPKKKFKKAKSLWD